MLFPDYSIPGLIGLNSSPLTFSNEASVEVRRFRRIREIFHFRPEEEIEIQPNTIHNNKNCMKENIKLK